MTDWISIALGVLLMVAAFATKGIRGAHSNGPLKPISLAGRVIFFLAGLVIFVDGVHALLAGR